MSEIALKIEYAEADGKSPDLWGARLNLLHGDTSKTLSIRWNVKETEGRYMLWGATTTLGRPYAALQPLLLPDQPTTPEGLLALQEHVRHLANMACHEFFPAPAGDSMTPPPPSEMEES